MPVATNYSVLRIDHFELTDQDLSAVKIADFELPADAVRHPAVLTSMVYPARDGSVITGAQFFFTLLMNDHALFTDMVVLPNRTVLFHGRFRQASTSMTIVIPVTSPPILRGGSNTLSIRPDSHDSNTGVGLSDIALWWQQDI